MREEYEIKKLNPRKNPYSNRLKKTDNDQHQREYDQVLQGKIRAVRNTVSNPYQFISDGLCREQS